MLWGSCTLEMRPHFDAIPYALMVVRRRNAFGGRLSRMLRELCALGMRPHFEAIPRASRVVAIGMHARLEGILQCPRVAYPRNARPI